LQDIDLVRYLISERGQAEGFILVE